jgi:hypothetical protein
LIVGIINSEEDLNQVLSKFFSILYFKNKVPEIGRIAANYSLKAQKKSLTAGFINSIQNIMNLHCRNCSW